MLLCLVKGFPGIDLDAGRLALMFAFLRFGIVFRAWLLGRTRQSSCQGVTPRRVKICAADPPLPGSPAAPGAAALMRGGLLPADVHMRARVVWEAVAAVVR